MFYIARRKIVCVLFSNFNYFISFADILLHSELQNGESKAGEAGAMRFMIVAGGCCLVSFLKCFLPKGVIDGANEHMRSIFSLFVLYLLQVAPLNSLPLSLDANSFISEMIDVDRFFFDDKVFGRIEVHLSGVEGWNL